MPGPDSLDRPQTRSTPTLPYPDIKSGNRNPNAPADPLKVVAVVNAGGDGCGRSSSSDDSASNAVTAAGGSVGSSVVARAGDVGGKSSGGDSGGTLVQEITLGSSGGIVIKGNSDRAIYMI